jgi:hypothetical protein
MTLNRALEVGNTYFTVFYPDEKLQSPVVETFVYLGADIRDNGESRTTEHIFQNARSYHQHGNWNQMTQDERAEYEIAPLLVLDAESLDPVVDIAGLIGEITQSLKRRDGAAF